MKSIPFRKSFTVPEDVYEGAVLDTTEGKVKITKIKNIKFVDMRTFIILGLCKPIK